MPDTGYLFDYYPLWVWGRLALNGANPYDQQLLRSGLASLGIVFNDPLSGQLPWSMWLYALFAVLPFNCARVLWGLSVFAGTAFFSLWCCSNFFKNPPKNAWAECCILLLSFSPVINNVRWGQVNFLICLGIAGFIHHRRLGQFRAAGLSLSFIFFKPHLFLPLLAYISASSIRDRDFRIPIWLSAGLSVQAAMSLILSPAIFLNYPEEAARSLTVTHNFLMPSFPILMSNWLNISSLRTIIPLSGIIAGAIAGWKRNSIASDLPLLLALSLSAAPYSWSHTFLPLLIPFLTTARRGLDCRRSVFLALVALLAALQYWISFETHMSLDYIMVFIPVGLLAEHMITFRSSGFRPLRQRILPAPDNRQHNL